MLSYIFGFFSFVYQLANLTSLTLAVLYVVEHWSQLKTFYTDAEVFFRKHYSDKSESGPVGINDSLTSYGNVDNDDIMKFSPEVMDEHLKERNHDFQEVFKERETPIAPANSPASDPLTL